ncbi:hypothetical protein P153DRAFT_251375, partial [Dothidotthia symphoricarpi CBS 119687]
TAKDNEAQVDGTKYCSCQQASEDSDDYMIACDNATCRYHWFHWKCVGVREAPIGDWMCPECEKQQTHDRS